MQPGLTLLKSKFLILLIALGVIAQAQDPTGLWRTIDDKTGKERGTVRLYLEAGEVFGRIESTVDPKEAASVCGLCPGDRKNKAIIGLPILRHMKKTGSDWTGGDILDPDTGSVYRCKFKITGDGNKMTLRGYLGVSLLGRSQVWMRQQQTY